MSRCLSTLGPRLSILRRRVELLVALFAGLLISVSLRAQLPPSPPGVRTSNYVPAIPLPPPPRSPVDAFRDLLGMTPIELKKALAVRPPPIRELLLAKVREYRRLKPEDRELRLWATELRWYLLPLLKTPATNRAARLPQVPSQLRRLVEDRLQEWDKLSADEQKQLLDNDTAYSYFIEWSISTPELREQMLTNLPPLPRQKLEESIHRWELMSKEQRQSITNRFNQFFNLLPGEKEEALRTLSEAERRQIAKTLQTFGNLSRIRREHCLQSFKKFASMSREEREQFLKNAERWKAMTPSERQTWRTLVNGWALAPPLPPGLRLPYPPMPPLRTNRSAAASTPAAPR